MASQTKLKFHIIVSSTVLHKKRNFSYPLQNISLFLIEKPSFSVFQKKKNHKDKLRILHLVLISFYQFWILYISIFIGDFHFA